MAPRLGRARRGRALGAAALAGAFSVVVLVAGAAGPAVAPANAQTSCLPPPNLLLSEVEQVAGTSSQVWLDLQQVQQDDAAHGVSESGQVIVDMLAVLNRDGYGWDCDTNGLTMDGSPVDVTGIGSGTPVGTGTAPPVGTGTGSGTGTGTATGTGAGPDTATSTGTGTGTRSTGPSGASGAPASSGTGTVGASGSGSNGQLAAGAGAQSDVTAPLNLLSGGKSTSASHNVIFLLATLLVFSAGGLVLVVQRQLKRSN